MPDTSLRQELSEVLMFHELLLVRLYAKEARDQDDPAAWVEFAAAQMREVLTKPAGSDAMHFDDYTALVARLHDRSDRFWERVSKRVGNP